MVPVPLVGIDRRRWCGRRAIPWDKPWDRKELKYLGSTGSWARRIMHHVQIQQIEGSHCCSGSHSYHAHMEISKVKIDEILQKLKDLFACRWDSRDIGTFVEGVDDHVGWAEIREQERYCVKSHYSRGSVHHCRVPNKTEEYVKTRIGLNRKLGVEQMKQVSAVLLIGIPEVESKIKNAIDTSSKWTTSTSSLTMTRQTGELSLTTCTGLLPQLTSFSFHMVTFHTPDYTLTRTQGGVLKH